MSALRSPCKAYRRNGLPDRASSVFVSHPSLGTVRPITFHWKQFLTLASKSFWVYLYGLAGAVFTTVSTLLITAGFGPDELTRFRYNTKLSELAYFVVNSACLASLPKILQGVPEQWRSEVKARIESYAAERWDRAKLESRIAMLAEWRKLRGGPAMTIVKGKVVWSL